MHPSLQAHSDRIFLHTLRKAIQIANQFLETILDSMEFCLKLRSINFWHQPKHSLKNTCKIEEQITQNIENHSLPGNPSQNMLRSELLLY